ncbi:MAG: phosphoribosylanthranilate isomerase [Chloroflexi bacterium]|nr:phosphoribosylanthranilate isomerase [Chloroflexota bacterium]
MKVKICGITTINDALMCAEAGADFIGLNFYPKSPRYLSRERARQIASALRDLPKPPVLVGVFVNESAAAMKAALDECGLDLAQLSGDESEDVLHAMGERGFKAIRNHQLPITNYQLLLFDAHAAGHFGGTGKTADWTLAAQLAKQCRLLLAGGLTPDNVALAIGRVQPWGVDVASGVETAPGVKDRAKVFAFIKAAKDVSNSNSSL